MSTARSLSYVLNRFLLRRAYLTARADGLTFRVKTEDVVGRHLYKYGRHEPELTAWLMRTLAPGEHSEECAVRGHNCARARPHALRRQHG